MRRRLGLALVLPLVALAGCASEAPAGGTDHTGAADRWHFYGSFTPERTDADMSAVCAAVEAEGEECVFMESFPEQYSFSFTGQAACERARATVLDVPHTDRVGACAPMPTTTQGDPEAPTSSG